MTRKVIINDDLQAFTRVPRFWAWPRRSSNRTPSGASYRNPVMTLDGKAIFPPAHNNLLTGVAAASTPTVTNSAPLTALAKARGRCGSRRLRRDAARPDSALHGGASVA